MDKKTEINEIIESSQLYLIKYYDDLKVKLDTKFQIKSLVIQCNQVKSPITKRWTNNIEIIDKCLAKCIKNKIPIEVINQTKETLIKSQSINENQLDLLKASLLSYLLSNDSFIAILIPKTQELLIGNIGLQPKEIEFFLKSACRIGNINSDLKQINNESLDNTDSNNNDMSYLRVIDLESLKEVIFLKLNLESYCSELNLIEYIKRFSHLKFLRIDNANIQNCDFLSEFKSIENVSFNKCNLSLLDSVLFLDLTQLIKLNFRSCSLTELNLNYLIHLKDLTFINCNINKLSEDMFANLFNLEKLFISDNESSLSLHQGCFNGLEKLENLKLKTASFSKLKKDIFVPLENLVKLSLNQQRNIPGDFFEIGCFNGLKRLVHLKLNNCNLSGLNHLIGLDSLEELEIKFNSGIRLKEKELKRLKLLNLSGCKILKLNESIIEGLKGLERLLLYYNYGIQIEKMFGDHFNKLKELDLTYCNLKLIKKDTFIGLNSLEKLHLGTNNDLFLEDGCFNGLNNLNYLDLSECCNLQLRVDVFLGLKNLETLYLINNSIIFFQDGCFVGLNRLKCLHLVKCKRLVLKENFFLGLVSLETLNLINNPNLLLRDGCFNELNRLKYLNLSNCSILKLEKNQFLGLNNLETLNLNFNSNIVLEVDCFNGLNRLKNLELSFCGNLELKKNLFFDLNWLESLELKYNQTILFENECFVGLNRLKCLNFCGCQILELKENLFFELENLKTLNLSYNPNLLLKDGCFNGLKNIQYIYT